MKFYPIILNMHDNLTFQFCDKYTDEQIKQYQNLLLLFREKFKKLKRITEAVVSDDLVIWGDAPDYIDNRFVAFRKNRPVLGTPKNIFASFPWNPNIREKCGYNRPQYICFQINLHALHVVRLCFPLLKMIVGTVGGILKQSCLYLDEGQTLITYPIIDFNGQSWVTSNINISKLDYQGEGNVYSDDEHIGPTGLITAVATPADPMSDEISQCCCNDDSTLFKFI